MAQADGDSPTDTATRGFLGRRCLLKSARGTECDRRVENVRHAQWPDCEFISVKICLRPPGYSQMVRQGRKGRLARLPPVHSRRMPRLPTRGGKGSRTPQRAAASLGRLVARPLRRSIECHRGAISAKRARHRGPPCCRTAPRWTQIDIEQANCRLRAGVARRPPRPAAGNDHLRRRAQTWALAARPCGPRLPKDRWRQDEDYFWLTQPRTLADVPAALSGCPVEWRLII